MKNIIPFNKPHLTGKENHYIYDAVNTGKISGNGKYTKLCQDFFQDKYGFKKCLLTTSCTDALEMASILIDLKEGDEVIMPSYTFVSTANAFILRGAKIVFADSNESHPGINEFEIEKLVSQKTKAIIPVHYAGLACDMDEIMRIADKYNLWVIEDAAQAINNYYIDKKGNKRALGSIGHLAAFSFHETKNIISGEGGMLVVNDQRFVERSEIIWEKGTNRAAFFRNEVDKYGWVDIGSSFLPSEIISAFLYAQLEELDDIQNKRLQIWNKYNENLKDWALNNNVALPYIYEKSTNNAHMFYLVFNSLNNRQGFIKHLKEKGILSVFHYLSLHKSEFFQKKEPNEKRELLNTDKFSDKLVRLPLFYDLSDEQQEQILAGIKEFNCI